MRWTPERLALLGHQPRDRAREQARRRLLFNSSSPGMTTTRGRLMEWWMRQTFKTGRSITFTDQEMSRDHLEERLRKVFPDSGRFNPHSLSFKPSSGPVRLLETTEAHSENARLEFAKLSSPIQEHYVDASAHRASLVCRYPCFICAALGKPQMITWKKK